MKSKYLIFIILCFLILPCRSQKPKKTSAIGAKVTHKFTNKLIEETSPYLLQHAHNPVNWHAWNKETLAKAKKENKLILISIGYAACHWCHVMEHESFENEEVAKIMNANFINIKVDREERPDVDKVYMTAVQLMTGSGGWPLNSIALPDGRPVWAGTYFPKDKWIDILKKISTLYKKDPKKLVAFAKKLSKGIQQKSLVANNPNPTKLSNDNLKQLVTSWSNHFDEVNGGGTRRIKFPMPSNYEFLLRYAHQTKDAVLMKYVNKTLTKMAYGGIFDQVGGGFARYSTDKRWHIPHFEKMLYDNAQLVSLYSNAYKATKNELYRTTVERTIQFLERELLDRSGAFYSSLDADSKDKHGHLEEGAFYVWTKEELKSLITDFDMFSAYYNVNSIGKWEKSNYNLIRTLSNKEFSVKYKISIPNIKKKVKNWNSILLKQRSKRSRPRLDDKVLTAWNGLMLKGYCDAYKATQNKRYLQSAKNIASFIVKKMTKVDNSLYRNYKNGKANINGFSQDYATVIDGYLGLYEVTFDEQWLTKSKKLADYCMLHFYDKSSGFFFFTSDEDEALILRDIETTDGVIPSSNAMMAKNLFLLSQYYDNKTYKTISQNMLEKHSNKIYSFPTSKSDWLQLHLDYTLDFYEVAITGSDCFKKNRQLSSRYIPNKLVVGAKQKSDLVLLKNRFTKGRTMLYVCQEKACLLPTSDVKTAINQLKRKE